MSDTGTGSVRIDQAVAWREAARQDGRRVVFTNGCFDILHAGHVEYLASAKGMGDLLVVGLNSDGSVSRLKGASRPYVPSAARARVLSALSSVDRVVVFDEDTPLRLIEALTPDILVKGGDWSVDRIVGRDAVIGWGGEVRSISSSHPEYSTTSLIERIRESGLHAEPALARQEGDGSLEVEARRLLRTVLTESIDIRRTMSPELAKATVTAALAIRGALQAGGAILFCGNGGSAADAQHLAAEFVGRFEREREGLASLALTTDTSILTAVANDYGFAQVFSRQVRALGRSGDVLVVLSTSGNSDNVIQAVATARERGLRTVGLLGRDGGVVGTKVDIPVVVNDASTARIQELHITLGHFFCGVADLTLPVGEA